jgi:hypothetical protein
MLTHNRTDRSHQRVQMAVALVMEVVRQPTLAHVILVLTNPDERALLLLRAHNPEIKAFWQGETEAWSV